MNFLLLLHFYMKPNFEPADENHEFAVGEEVYLIDNNKVDI